MINGEEKILKVINIFKKLRIKRQYPFQLENSICLQLLFKSMANSGKINYNMSKYTKVGGDYMQGLLSQFLTAPSIIILVLAVLVIAYLIHTRNWHVLRAIAYKLMIQAEQTTKGDSRGKERFDAVFDDLYKNHLPKWFSLFVSEDQLKVQIQKWYDELEVTLKDENQLANK